MVCGNVFDAFSVNLFNHYSNVILTEVEVLAGFLTGEHNLKIYKIKKYKIKRLNCNCKKNKCMIEELRASPRYEIRKNSMET